MSKRHQPRCGSLAFYPRKRAVRETASFRSIPFVGVPEGEGAKPLNFIAYKVGMTHVIGKDSHEKGTSFGQEITIPATVAECPPIKVFGIRAYGKAQKGYGETAMMDVLVEKADKALQRRIVNFKKKPGKKSGGKEKKAGEKEEKAKNGKNEKTVSDLDAAKEKISKIMLLSHSQPALTGIGKKKPAVIEIALSGSVEQQIAFAKESLGKDIKFSDAFSPLEFIDVKAVTKGKGTQGPVKRFGIRMHRPKAKKRRVVGSIGPWNPSTVMWTVPRPGQMGYHTRTEYNKKILMVGENGQGINPAEGFKNYGVVKNDFIVFSGSIPGPAKRAISLRKCIRPHGKERHKIEGIDFIATNPPKAGVAVEVEEKLTQKVELEKEKKKEQKSVAEEIAEAAKGGSK